MNLAWNHVPSINRLNIELIFKLRLIDFWYMYSTLKRGRLVYDCQGRHVSINVCLYRTWIGLGKDSQSADYEYH